MPFAIVRMAAGITPVVAIVGLLFGLHAVPADAAPVITVPAGCQQIMTVEKDSCLVVAYFQCGAQLKAAEYEAGFAKYLTSFTRDLAHLDHRTMNGARQEIVWTQGSGQALSLQSLVRTGESRADQPVRVRVNRQTVNARIAGVWKLRNGRKRISGVPFRRVTAEIVTSSGGRSTTFDVVAYLSEEHGILVDGKYTERTADGRRIVHNETPKAVHMPGSTRFSNAFSRYGCRRSLGALPYPLDMEGAVS